MSFKLPQFPSQATTRIMRVPMRWTTLDGSIGASGFLNLWLGDDNEPEKPRRRLNWGAMAGLAISFVISGGFWAGVGVLVSRAVR